MDNFIEMTNFQGILDAIFNGNLDLYKILTLSVNLPDFFIKMINYINSSASNENKNKYFFIICYIIASTDDSNTIFEHLISVIGIDRFIEIVFQIDYGTEFDRIITSSSYNIERMNEIKIKVVKSDLFMKLIRDYSKKMLLDEFKELLTKLFSIQNISFIELILNDLFLFFTNEFTGYQIINSSFKLFDFLLENKQRFQNFIKIFKLKFNIQNPYRFFIRQRVRNIIGTEETQTELFRNV